MNIDSISTAVASAANSPDARNSGDAVGRDAFLKLLVTQLRNQDPMQPEDNGAFLAQLAQFSSLEQLQQIGQDINRLVTGLESLVTPATVNAASASTGGA